MKIFNVRLGLATNSSSTHSLIFVNQPVRDRGVQDREFGWDSFTAASTSAKVDYLALLLYYSMKDLDEATKRTIINEWINPSQELLDGVAKYDSYIDHQSVRSLPRARDGVGLDREFVRDLKAFLLQPNLAILGGNDNEDTVHPLGGGFTLPYFAGVARKDPVYNYWTIFNQETGCKIRFSFDSLAEEPERAFAPELVDIKITDRCLRQCPYCYQDSTPSGKHADSYNLYVVTVALQSLGVFEVALGGGEPLLREDFHQILRSFRSAGIVPNFSTRRTDWLLDVRKWGPIMDACGGFALSVDDAEQVQNLAARLTVNGIDHKRASVQVIPEVVGPYTLYNILLQAAHAHIAVTLLGYKATGRGAQFSPYTTTDTLWPTILKVLKDTRREYFRISVDTVLAAAWKEQILEAGIPRYLFHTEEGTFSWYIDAVSKQMGPSSYGEELIDIADGSGIVGHLDQKILDAYAEGEEE